MGVIKARKAVGRGVQLVSQVMSCHTFPGLDSVRILVFHLATSLNV